jgi:hypothetical protein
MTLEPEPTGLAIDIRRPKQSELFDLRAKAPTWVQALNDALMALKGEPVEERDVLVPAREVAHLCAFFASLTLAVKGADGPDNQPLSWHELDDDERVLFWEHLPSDAVQSAYGYMIAQLAADNDPDYLERVAEAVRDLDGEEE